MGKPSKAEVFRRAAPLLVELVRVHGHADDEDAPVTARAIGRAAGGGASAAHSGNDAA